MAFFKFRWPGQKAQGDSAKPTRRSRSAHAESIDVMRRRARHRLIGAAVLVLIGIIGFPMLFDTQPRPVAVDIPIEIPDRNKVAPLVVPDTAKPPAVAEAKPAAQVYGAVTGGSSAGLDAGEEVVVSRSEPKPAAPAVAAFRAEHKPEAKAEVKHETREPAKPTASPEPAKPARNDDAARARALLEGRTAVAQQAQPAAAVSKPDEDGRFIVQVGAFADAEKAREARSKLERSGLKTYMQVVDTKEGKRTRVRVGPFANRPEADKAAGRIKALGLSASVLTL